MAKFEKLADLYDQIPALDIGDPNFKDVGKASVAFLSLIRHPFLKMARKITQSDVVTVKAPGKSSTGEIYSQQKNVPWYMQFSVTIPRHANGSFDTSNVDLKNQEVREILVLDAIHKMVARRLFETNSHGIKNSNGGTAKYEDVLAALTPLVMDGPNGHYFVPRLPLERVKTDEDQAKEGLEDWQCYQVSHRTVIKDAVKMDAKNKASGAAKDAINDNIPLENLVINQYSEVIPAVSLWKVVRVGSKLHLSLELKQAVVKYTKPTFDEDDDDLRDFCEQAAATSSEPPAKRAFAAATAEVNEFTSVADESDDDELVATQVSHDDE